MKIESAAREFVALDIEPDSPQGVKQIAGIKVPREGQAEPFSLWIDANPLALRAHQNATPHVLMENFETLERAGERLLILGGTLPWVVFEASDGLETLLAVRRGSVLGGGGGGDLWEVRELACYLLPEAGDASLGELGRAVGLDWEQGTEFAPGLGGASALTLIFGELYERLLSFPLALVQGVANLLGRSDHPLAGVWQRAVRQRAGEEVSASVHQLLRSRLRQLYPPLPPAEDSPPPARPLDTDLIRSHFEPDGTLARQHPNYEHRPGQVEMAVAVAQAFNQEQLLLVEAGTGTGKSLAYLVPSLYWATTNHRKVVVSTNTKNLQDQLFTQDLPFLRRALGLEFQAELIKGRNNYLCLEKLLREWEDADFALFDEQRIFLAYLACWAWQTKQGDLDEIHAWMRRRYPRLKAYLATVASDSETCLSPGRRNHSCYAALARRRALAADLLIINHSLALANAATPVLPLFTQVVFDEAHNLEDIATNTFGRELSRRDLALELHLLRGRGREWGLLQRVRRALDQLPAEDSAPLESKLNELDYLLPRLEESIDQFTIELGRAGFHLEPESRPSLGHPQRQRLGSDWWDQPAVQSLLLPRDNLQAQLREVVTHLTHLAGHLYGQTETLAEGERLAVDTEAARNRWTEIADSFHYLLKLENPENVYWLELVLHREQLEWRLQAAPINPGEDLAAQIYHNMQTVILTSATLTVHRRFDYFRERLGLDEVQHRLQELWIPSSFPYRQQVLLAVPNDMPLPRDIHFDETLAAALRELMILIRGRTLVLFTAYASLERVFHRIQGALEEAGIEILAQRISGSRHYIAERFRRNPASVLLGTKSFWEGIDVPGEALQCVVIVKLPFAVPDDPMVQARCEYLERQGLDSRTIYYEPLAIIQFKQGFGRLIRAATDHGVVIVFDRRLLTQPYGRRFLDSVPGYTFLNAPWYEVVARAQWWLTEQK